MDNSVCKQCGYFFCNCFAADNSMESWKKRIIKAKEEQHRKIKFKIEELDEVEEEEKKWLAKD